MMKSVTKKFQVFNGGCWDLQHFLYLVKIHITTGHLATNRCKHFHEIHYGNCILFINPKINPMEMFVPVL